MTYGCQPSSKDTNFKTGNRCWNSGKSVKLDRVNTQAELSGLSFLSLRESVNFYVSWGEDAQSPEEVRYGANHAEHSGVKCNSARAGT